MKNKLTTIGIIIATVILAGIAIFTAMRLYQTRNTQVAPNAPESEPAAGGTMCGGIQGLGCPAGETCIYSDGRSTPPFPDASGTCTVGTGGGSSLCQLNFTIATPTPTPTPTRSPSPTPTRSPSPTPTPIPLCNSTCTTTSQCPSGMTCSSGRCRNPLCTSSASCVCATATPSPTPTPTKTPSPTPTPTTPPTGAPTSTPIVTVTASPNPQCNYACTSNSNCPSGLICYIADGQTAGNCRNTQCLSETDCTCPLAEVPPTTAPTLPEVGTGWPTIVGSAFGILVLLGSLLLAL